MKQGILCVAFCALAGSMASAADFEATRLGQTALRDVVMIDNTLAGGTYSDTVDAGMFNFEFTDIDGVRGVGQFAEGRFTTFCAELQPIRNGARLYDLIPVVDGPNPESLNFEGPYDDADDAELNAVVAAAIRLGWINPDLSPTATATLTTRAAIQIGIWRTLLDNSVFTVLDGSVESALMELEAEASSVPDARVAGLLLMANADTQDMLFVVDDQPPVLVCDAEKVIEQTYSPCDWNRDGRVDSRDVVAFVHDYKRCDADFNGDGWTNFRDFCEFVHCYRTAKYDGKCGDSGDDAQLYQISFSAEDDGGDVFIEAYIETECEQIPVMNGEIIEVRCEKPRKRRHAECSSEIIDNRLVITAREVRLVVIARDSSGNIVECGKVLCEPKGDHKDDCDDDHKGGKGGKDDDCDDDRKGGKGRGGRGR